LATFALEGCVVASAMVVTGGISEVCVGECLGALI